MHPIKKYTSAAKYQKERSSSPSLSEIRRSMLKSSENLSKDAKAIDNKQVTLVARKPLSGVTGNEQFYARSQALNNISLNPKKKELNPQSEIGKKYEAETLLYKKNSTIK